MAKPKLCEIVSITSGKKSESTGKATEIYHKFQKTDLFDGMFRTYQPFNDEDPDKPPTERKEIRACVTELINEASSMWSNLFDLVLTLDSGNQEAKEDIIFEDGTVFMTGVPVTTLLYMEKDLLQKVKTLIKEIPTPDPSENWTFDNNSGRYKTDEITKLRVKKVQKAITIAPATERHPEQAQLISEDIPVGNWKEIKNTSRIPVTHKQEMLNRCSQLIDAVKAARERANSIHIDKKAGGQQVFNFIFGGSVTADKASAKA